jgi:CBS domain-containing protein
MQRKQLMTRTKKNPFTLRARDFMQTGLMTITPETPLADVQRMFVEEEIHGAPVVDDQGVVRGIVSSLDLLRDSADLEGRGGGELTATDAMTRELVSVTSDTPVAEIAEKMRLQHIHRVLVIDDEELVGVVTSFDLLRALTPGTRA